MRFGDAERELCGGEILTTNNRMELAAAIEGLSALNKRCIVNLYTDSKYVRSGITEWLAQWKRRGWLTASRKPVKNEDLWRRLDDLAAGHEIQWHWVRGHDGNEGNERADQLANKGLENALASRSFGD
jgi:ribonuclease HI